MKSDSKKNIRKSKAEEIKEGIEKDFPDSNIRIQQKLFDEDETHYFYAHGEIRLQDSSRLEMGEIISHNSLHFQALLNGFYSVLEGDENSHNVSYALEKGINSLEELNREISNCIHL